VTSFTLAITPATSDFAICWWGCNVVLLHCGPPECELLNPVDPVSRAATLELAAGSHLGPWLMPRTFMDDEAQWFPEGALAELPYIGMTSCTHRVPGRLPLTFQALPRCCRPAPP
jgi:hypothetical protein